MALSAEDVRRADRRRCRERFRQRPAELRRPGAAGAGDRLVLNDGLPGHGMLYARFLDADRRLGGDALCPPGAAAPRPVRLGRRPRGRGPRAAPSQRQRATQASCRRGCGRTTGSRCAWCTTRSPTRSPSRTPTAAAARAAAGHRPPGALPATAVGRVRLSTGGRLTTTCSTAGTRAQPLRPAAHADAPRISIGDVVIARRRWYGGGELATAVGAGPDEHERLLALTAWRAHHGVPEEVVVKTVPEDEGPLSSGAPDAQPRAPAHKPQYVDLSSALSTRVLPRMLERRADGGRRDYLEEALPGVADGTHARSGWWRSDGGPVAGSRTTRRTTGQRKESGHDRDRCGQERGRLALDRRAAQGEAGSALRAGAGRRLLQRRARAVRAARLGLLFTVADGCVPLLERGRPRTSWSRRSARSGPGPPYGTFWASSASTACCWTRHAHRAGRRPNWRPARRDAGPPHRPPRRPVRGVRPSAPGPGRLYGPSTATAPALRGLRRAGVADVTATAVPVMPPTPLVPVCDPAMYADPALLSGRSGSAGGSFTLIQPAPRRCALLRLPPATRR